MTNHDELCEKVFPVTKRDSGEPVCSCSWDGMCGNCMNLDAQDGLKQALSAGLLCEGKKLEALQKTYDGYREHEKKVYNDLKKELEEAKKWEQHTKDYIRHLHKKEEQLASLKLKLSEAEKALNSSREHDMEGWNLYAEACDEIEKLSGSCEGMTVESLEEIIKNWRSPQGGKFTPYFCKYAAKSIHDQMMGGKK